MIEFYNIFLLNVKKQTIYKVEIAMKWNGLSLLFEQIGL
jgi:hypothetical protein